MNSSAAASKADDWDEPLLFKNCTNCLTYSSSFGRQLTDDVDKILRRFIGPLAVCFAKACIALAIDTTQEQPLATALLSNGSPENVVSNNLSAPTPREADQHAAAFRLNGSS
jgi:hypothetical protein